MMSQLEHAIRGMRDVLDRAEIRDAARIRGLRYALTVALLAPDLLTVNDEEHAEFIREALDLAARLALPVRGVPREDALASIREVVAEFESDGAGPLFADLNDLRRRA